jgi:drug/metabolite transporter (DMT)-like permease
LKNRYNTIFLAIIACLLWSTVYPAIKIGLEYAPPFHFAGIRFIVSGLMILPFTARSPLYIKMIRDHWRMVLWVTALQTLLNYSLFYHGLKLVPGAIGAIIVGSQPLITAIVSAIMIKEEKLSWNKILTIIVGISGVVLISAGRQALRLGTIVELLGVLMIFGANFATATSNVIISARSKGMNPFVLSSFTLFTGGIIIFIMSLLTEQQPPLDLPAKYWVILGWLSFTSASAFSIWYYLLQRPGVKVSELNLWKFIIPVTGAVLSWVFVPGEHPDWLTITGIIIISVSLIGFFRSNDKKKKREGSRSDSQRSFVPEKNGI